MISWMDVLFINKRNCQPAIYVSWYSTFLHHINLQFKNSFQKSESSKKIFAIGGMKQGIVLMQRLNSKVKCHTFIILNSKLAKTFIMILQPIVCRIVRLFKFDILQQKIHCKVGTNFLQKYVIIINLIFQFQKLTTSTKDTRFCYATINAMDNQRSLQSTPLSTARFNHQI
jgi:hypothetical protein